MTYEKAIHTILKGCIYRDKRGGEALEVAINALEKQIPKKPINRKGTTYFYCPFCGGNRLNNYCADCGQALDWSDTE